MLQLHTFKRGFLWHFINTTIHNPWDSSWFVHARYVTNRGRDFNSLHFLVDVRTRCTDHDIHSFVIVSIQCIGIRVGRACCLMYKSKQISRASEVQTSSTEQPLYFPHRPNQFDTTQFGFAFIYTHKIAYLLKTQHKKTNIDTYLYKMHFRGE